MMMKNIDKIITNKIVKILTTIFIVLISMVFSPLVLSSQQLNLPLSDYYSQQINFEINKSQKIIHTGFKPLIKSEVNIAVDIDSVLYDFEKKTRFFQNHKKNIIWRKLLFEDFVSVQKKNFSLYVNPLFYMEKGITQDTKNLFINTRGIELKGNLGKKISYYSSFRENQARYRSYIYNWSWERLVTPGQGAFKKNNKDLSLFDFSMASAYLSYSPIDWLNIQIGQDKHFIGEGHRSLLISDNAYNYPFVKISTDYKNFKYTTLFTEFRDFEDAYYQYHFKKHGAFNYLSYNYKNLFEVGLFEGIIYRTTDTSEYVNKFKADFFIPVIGVRTAVNGFASEHNVIMGLNAKFKVTEFIQIYGQMAFDDLKQKKISYQGGMKIFDVFHSTFENQRLFILAEFNYSRPRTYSHQNLKYQTWSHYNQELSHPAGSDFKEYFVNLTYSFFKFSVNYRYNNLILNNKSTFSDIYVLDQNNYLITTEPFKINHHSTDFAYTINPRTGLQLYVGIDIRISDKYTDQSEKYFMFGIRTQLANFRYDF